MAETAVFILEHLLIFGGLAATCYVLGRTLAWRLVFESAAEKAVAATTLGLAVLGQILFLLGLAGLLDRIALVVVLAAIHVAGWRAWREAFSAAARSVHRDGLGRRLVMPLLTVVAISPLVLLALYPPTAFDATGYHLPQAKAFAATGSLPALANLVQPVFPAHGESLFAAMLLFFDDISTQEVELLAGLLTAALLAVWGRRLFGAPAGAMAAALYLGNPAIVYLLGSAYIDPGFCLFAVGAVYSLDRWRRQRDGRWLAVAAACAGAADATKYLGLFFAGLAGLAALMALGRSETRRWGAFALLILLVSVGTCHGRIARLTGNPVHPYFQSVFGRGAWTVPEADNAAARLLRSRSPAQTLAMDAVDVMRLPWDLVFAREKFEPNPPISPWYMLLAPVAIIGAFRYRAVRGLLLLAALYAYVVWLLPRNARYLFPALALGSVAWGGALKGWLAASGEEYPVFRRLPIFSAPILLLPGILYAGWRFLLCGPLPTDAVARDRYLRKMLPAYSALSHLNRSHGERFTVYVLGAPNLDYFSEGVFYGEYNGPASYRRIFPRDRNPSALYRNLQRLGVDHLLVPKPLPPRLAAPDGDPGFGRFFRLVFSDTGGSVYALEEPETAPAPERASTTSLRPGPE